MYFVLSLSLFMLCFLICLVHVEAPAAVFPISRMHNMCNTYIHIYIYIYIYIYLLPD